MKYNNVDNKYYIYAWYYVNTGEIFYIGKGCENRWKDIKNRRNNYFKSIIEKEGNNVDVKKLYENLLQDDAWELERKLIHEYWNKGECKANFHEGGRGGNHGNYGENMRRKLSEFAKTRTGSKNSHYGGTATEEGRRKMSVAAKAYHKLHPLTEEHKRKMHENSSKFWKSDEGRKLRSKIMKGRKYSEEYVKLNRDRQCPNNYIVVLNNQVLFESRYRKDVIKYCEDNLHISRNIFFQLLHNKWTPKFNKHQHLKSLKIITEVDKYKNIY